MCSRKNCSEVLKLQRKRFGINSFISGRKWLIKTVRRNSKVDFTSGFNKHFQRLMNEFFPKRFVRQFNISVLTFFYKHFLYSVNIRKTQSAPQHSQLRRPVSPHSNKKVFVTKATFAHSDTDSIILLIHFSFHTCTYYPK